MYMEAKSKIRVAAYCRVSTADAAQASSLAAQRGYYEAHIQANAGWIFAGVYADNGKSGTGMAKRTAFLRLLADCEAGHIDLVLTKSVSRFARNTVDCIEAVRRLAKRGIAVYFEKERLHTLSARGELLLTALSAVAQEESASKSRNIKWRYQRDFRRGVYRQGKMPYGYTKANGCAFVPDADKADVVRRVFRSFLNGESPARIAEGLNRDGIPTPAYSAAWTARALYGMLRNERYAGDMLLQKSYARDGDETYRRRRNRGERDRYYIQDSHTNLISREEFKRVGEMLDGAAGRLYGYAVRNGVACINEAQAACVRKAYAAYAEGASIRGIAHSLLMGAKAVRSILKNGQYMGGVRPAIVPAALYERVQARLRGGEA